MPKRYEELVEKFVSWARGCNTPDCLEELFTELQEYEFFGRRSARGEQFWDYVRDSIREEFSKTVGRDVYRHTYERWVSEGRKGRMWFTESGSQRIAEAYYNGLEEGLRREALVRYMVDQSGLSIVAIRHWLYELARMTGSEDVVELARIARSMERARYGT